MRNINCSEDRVCTLESMEKANQKGGGGLASAQNEYMIPYSEALSMLKRDRLIQKRKPKQTGKGRPRKQKTLIKTSAIKRRTSKRSPKRKKSIRKILKKSTKKTTKRRCCIEI